MNYYLEKLVLKDDIHGFITGFTWYETKIVNYRCFNGGT